MTVYAENLTARLLENHTAIVYYAYSDPDWGDLLTSYNGQTITYDTIGNPLSDGTWTYTWEHGRQLASMASDTVTWTYAYNADGLRTSRSNGTDTYTYVYNGSQLSQMTIGDNVLRFTYDASGLARTVTWNGTVYYYATNLQGDIIAILDADGNAVVEYIYDAWGNIHSTSGTLSATLGTLNPLRYRGYVYDTETGLYYLQSRYYNPEIGRFINADSYASTGQGVLGNNMFAYCGNGPTNASDPCGHCKHERFFWNDCEQCGGRTLSEKLEDVKLAQSKGNYLALNLGPLNLTATLEAAYDIKGNIQLFSTFGIDVTSSVSLAVSGGSVSSVFFVPTTSDIGGGSYYIGGGVGIPVPETPIGISASASILQTTSGYYGVTTARGISFPTDSIGLELHGGYSYSHPWTPQINIFDTVEYVIGFLYGEE